MGSENVKKKGMNKICNKSVKRMCLEKYKFSFKNTLNEAYALLCLVVSSVSFWFTNPLFFL